MRLEFALIYLCIILVIVMMYVLVERPTWYEERWTDALVALSFIHNVFTFMDGFIGGGVAC